MKHKNIAVYLFYIVLSDLFIVTAAMVQMTFVYHQYTPKLFIVPLSVGALFGILIAKIRILQREQKASLQEIRQKEEEIRELNSTLEKKVELKIYEAGEQRLYTEAILNAQHSIVVITDGYSLVKANRTFFRYFDDFVSMDDFHRKHNCICDLFVKKEGYIQPDMNDARWTTYILDHPEENHRAFVRFHEKEYYFSVHAKKFIFGNTQRIIVTFEDITDLVHYEEELQLTIDSQIESSRKKDAIIHEQARFTAVGEALQSVSHHWRQPLSALSLLIQDVKDAQTFDELDKTYLENFFGKSLSLIQDMSETLDSFQYIFSEDFRDKQELDVEQAARRAVSIIRPNLVANAIELQIEVKHPRVIIKASPNEYIQVLLSILTNAVDALEQKAEDRKIVITIDKDEAERSQLSIFNNGLPIRDEHIDKIFDPYFSTKFEKNGTGLGLFVTKNILENRMKGSISVANLPNGVEFQITV